MCWAEKLAVTWRLLTICVKGSRGSQNDYLAQAHFRIRNQKGLKKVEEIFKLMIIKSITPNCTTVAYHVQRM